MTKEFLGENAVREMFDIIAENYVSCEELKESGTSIASAISVGSALISASLLKVAEAIVIAKGGEGGVEVDEEKIATDSEVDEVIGQYFNNDGNNFSVSEDMIATDSEVNDLINNYFGDNKNRSSVDDGEVATDEEVADVLNKYFQR